MCVHAHVCASPLLFLAGAAQFYMKKFAKRKSALCPYRRLFVRNKKN